jgi:CRP-like cAMP-binding protein
MNSQVSHLDRLANLIWEPGVNRSFVSNWCKHAQTVNISAGQVITKQYHPADYFYFLVDGEVEHSLKLEGLNDSFKVGGVSLHYFPLGWSGFSLPHRYATTAQATADCKLLRWSTSDLQQLFYRAPHLGARFYQYLLSSVLNLLGDARLQLKRTPPATGLLVEALSEKPGGSNEPDGQNAFAEILAHSLFFEVFPESCIDRLQELVEIRHYSKGECIYQQGAQAECLAILLDGSVASSFSAAGGQGEVYLRSYTTPGQIIAHPDLTLSGKHEETACAITHTRVALISSGALEQLAEEMPEFGLLWAQRLLWLVSSRLRTLRIQLIAQRYDQEHIAVQNLLAQVSPQLGIASRLYKLPHLLAKRITHAEAFDCLGEVKRNGSRLERTLAGICLDLLSEVRRELRFYEGLLNVYQDVIQAPLDSDPRQVRELCSQRFQQAFSATRYVIRGTENLPASPGNIFILNHLVSHPYHALPNGFELALDTHFVSAMILAPKYGDGGVRVVRRGRGEEHGHHSYYDRLGHIYVHTAESDPLSAAGPEQEANRAAFNALAGDYLAQGTNLIICPEGTSKWSQESPAPFRKGSFHLAAALDPEPLIVPIAVANFDKRLKHNAFAAVIHEPFRISDRCDPGDKESLAAFLDDYRTVYRGYVEEAMTLAQAACGESEPVEEKSVTSVGQSEYARAGG